MPPYLSGTLYPGTVLTLTAPSLLDRHGKRTAHSRPGTVTLTGAEGRTLSCLFWSAPPALADPAVWPALIGRQAVMSFHVKRNDQGTVFRFIETLDIATDAAGALPAEDAPAQPTTATTPTDAKEAAA